MDADLKQVKAVMFDAFGTLVQVGDRRGPYRKLYQLLLQHGLTPHPDDSQRIMCADVGLSGVPGLFGMELPASLIAPLERELYAELRTIRLYDETLATLAALRAQGYKLGLCSNLAAPYAVPVEVLLPSLDVYAWSFRVGAVKPDRRIYSWVCEALECSPDQVLMVGDTLHADYVGAIAMGLRVVHLSRDGTSPADRSIRRLDEIADILQGAWGGSMVTPPVTSRRRNRRSLAELVADTPEFNRVPGWDEAPAVGLEWPLEAPQTVPENVDALPTHGVAEYVARVATAHHVRYTRSAVEAWAEAVTRAAGDEVEVDETTGLLIRLRQRDILNAAQFTRLLVNYNRELKPDLGDQP